MDNDVIRNCHIGRSTFYRMKRGELINVNAYLRMTDYAMQKIRERMKKIRSPVISRKDGGKNAGGYVSTVQGIEKINSFSDMKIRSCFEMIETIYSVIR